MYVIGGDPQCTGEVLDLGALKWEHLPELITPRSGHRIGVAKGRIICAGGMDSSGSLLRSVEVRKCWREPSPCFWIPWLNHPLESVDQGFDPREGKWTALPGLQLARSGAGMTTLNNTHIYVVGGIGQGREDLSSVEILDMRMIKWENGPTLETGRSNLSAAVVDGHILALGGYQVTRAPKRRCNR